MPLYEIEAEGITEGNQLSRTEIAKIIGNHSDWRLNDAGEVISSGEKVADSIEDAAVAMMKLGWIGEGLRSNRFPLWELMPQRGADRAAAVRRALSSS